MADISIINKDNTDYNVKDTAGRLALAEVENKGAKNQFSIASSDAIDYKTTHNISGDTVTITGSAGFSRYVVPVSLKAGSYIFTANVNSISTSGRVRFNTASDGTGTNVTSQIDFSQAGSISRDFTINQDTAFFVMIYSSTSSADTSSSLVISQCMICTKAEWDISQAYVPYGKTNAELTSDISALSTENTSQQAEINYAVNAGVKNLFDINETPIVNHTTYTLTDEKLTVIANGTWAHYSVPIDLPAGNYILSLIISDYSKASGAPDTSIRMRMAEKTSGVTYIVLQTITGNGAINVPFTWTGGTIYLQFYPNFNATAYANSFSAADVMIRPASITDDMFVPHALPNPTLTPAVIKAVDCGAKNRLPLTGESTDIFTINADGTMTANGSSSTSKRDFAYYIGSPPKGIFVFSGCPPTGSNTTYRMFLQSVVGSTYTTLATLTGDPVEVDLTNIDKIRVLMSIYAGYTPNNIKFSPMLCTKAEWDISHTYVPYAPTNRELYETGQLSYDFIFGLGIELQQNEDLNNYNKTGKIFAATGAIAATILNTPWTSSGFMAITIPLLTTITYMQFVIPSTYTGKWYRRRYTQGAWSAWIEYDETEINGLLPNIDSSTTITAYANSLAKGHYTSFIANTSRPSDAPVADNMFIEIYIYSANTALIRAFPTGSVYGNQFFQKSKVSGVWRNWNKFEGTEVT